MGFVVKFVTANVSSSVLKTATQ